MRPPVNAIRHQVEPRHGASADGMEPVRLQNDLPTALADLAGLPALAGELLNQCPIQMLIVDQNLQVRWVNGVFSRARKVAVEQIVGRPVAEFFGDLSSHASRFSRAFSGEPTHLLMSSHAADGATWDLNVFLRPIRDNDGNVPALCVFIGDLGFQRIAEEGLPGTAQAMRQVIGSLPDLVLVLDRELHILFANRALGPRTAEQMEGLHITEFLPEHLRPVALACMHRVLANGQVDSYGSEIEGVDGQARHFDVRVSAIRREQRIVGLTLNATEITEQIRAERAIATQARMIESMLEGVAVINESGVIEITNPAFDSLFGYGRGELIGREMSTLADRPLEQRRRRQPGAASGGPTDTRAGSTNLEFDGRHRSGRHFSAAGVLSKFEVAGHNHRLVVLQDVSERKQLERAILQAVNREQYRIGNDLHDGLGQELTGIALMLRGLAGRVTGEYPPIQPEIESITRLVSNAIESTRALARGLSPVNLERGGLQDALEGLAMHASELYGVPTVFTHRVPANRPLNAELANHLYRIAQEAVRNAVRHGHARSIRLHLSAARAKVRLAITDDGVGMPPGAMDATGMGLKIMCYRARILGGEVSFEPAKPTGTRVVCECPVQAAGAPVRRPPKRRAPASQSS
jgi:PAS domain S-box-containing protein